MYKQNTNLNFQKQEAFEIMILLLITAYNLYVYQSLFALQTNFPLSTTANKNVNFDCNK